MREETAELSENISFIENVATWNAQRSSDQLHDFIITKISQIDNFEFI